MSQQYEKLREKAFSAFSALAKECPEYADARIIVGSAEAQASLSATAVKKSVDTSWIDAIEKALPALDTVVRSPAVAIEDVDEVLPVELSRHITERSLKHLAQHTNLIQAIEGDDITPEKILNVYHDETYLTYENKFVNTLLNRLYAFVDKRYKALAKGSGCEQNYKFDYTADFTHGSESGSNTAKVHLSIALNSPDSAGDEELISSYKNALSRVERIAKAMDDYQSSFFSQKLGRNYIRPPVIRTNAILKNKNLKECLTLWEYIEGFDKVGYSVRVERESQMPSDNYISDMYSTVALQYVDFFNGVTQGEESRLLAKSHAEEKAPEFVSLGDDAIDTYWVYDYEYKKIVPVAGVAGGRKKSTDEEKELVKAILVALKADDMITAEKIRRRKAAEREAERIRIAEEKRIAAEEARRKAEEERILAEKEAARLAAEAERARIAAEEAERLAEQERKRKEQEELERKIAAEARRIAEEKARRIAEQEAMRLAEEERLIAEAERRRFEEMERIRKKQNREMRGIGQAEIPDFVFRGEPAYGCNVILPCTRAQYNAMSRKKKKQVLSKARENARNIK